MSENEDASRSGRFGVAYVRLVGDLFLVISALSFCWAVVALMFDFLQPQPEGVSVSETLKLAVLTLIFGLLLRLVSNGPFESD